MAADRVIRWTTAGAVAGVAAMTSYEHAHALVRAHGEAGRTGRPVPLTMDGLIYVTSVMMLDSARRKVPVRALASWLLGLGIAATLAANVAHGLGDGLAGATVAAWPTVALVGSYELLMMIISSAAGPAEQSAQPPRDARLAACARISGTRPSCIIMQAGWSIARTVAAAACTLAPYRAGHCGPQLHAHLAADSARSATHQRS
jgi:Protein of unknown function (DUF2637)